MTCVNSRGGLRDRVCTSMIVLLRYKYSYKCTILLYEYSDARDCLDLTGEELFSPHTFHLIADVQIGQARVPQIANQLRAARVAGIVSA